MHRHRDFLSSDLYSVQKTIMVMLRASLNGYMYLKFKTPCQALRHTLLLHWTYASPCWSSPGIMPRGLAFAIRQTSASTAYQIHTNTTTPSANKKYKRPSRGYTPHALSRARDCFFFFGKARGNEKITALIIPLRGGIRPPLRGFIKTVIFSATIFLVARARNAAPPTYVTLL